MPTHALTDAHTAKTRAAPPYLCACEHDLARDEDEQHNLGVDHAVDQTGKQLGLVLDMEEGGEGR